MQNGVTIKCMTYWNPNRTKLLIEEKGYTRKWLASRCGITVSGFNNILRGTKPSLPVLKLLAQALDTTVDDLLDVGVKAKASGE